LVQLALLALAVLLVRLVVLVVLAATQPLVHSSLPTAVGVVPVVPSRLLQQAVVEVAALPVLVLLVVLLAALVAFLRQVPTQLVAKV
jgi:hypothetical protein